MLERSNNKMINDSTQYWIIPIFAFILVVILFASALDYKLNTVIPNAAIERTELSKMSCADIIQKNSLNQYWTPENGKIGRALTESCKPIKESSGVSPYIEFCDPTTEWAPVSKIIQNSTHNWNHVICVWENYN